jgi:hypothetical protein
VQAGLETAPRTARSSPVAVEPKAEAKKAKKKKARTADKSAAEAAPRTVEITPADEPEKPKFNVETTWKSGGTAKTYDSAKDAPATRTCSECRTQNDPDAVFCKKCGSKMFGDGSAEEPAGQTETETDEPSKTEAEQ